jgi:hypothetical protein
MRAKDLGGYAGGCRDPPQREAVIEADQDVPEVDEKSAQDETPLYGRASWPVRR